jgi:hypothetical protein
MDIIKSADAERLHALAPLLALGTLQLTPDDERALIRQITDAAKVTRDPEVLGALSQISTKLVHYLRPHEAGALSGMITLALQQRADVETADALLQIAGYFSWPNNAQMIVSVLKFPTIYGRTRDVLLEGLNRHLGTATIRAPGDLWAVAERLRNEPMFDLITPPRRKTNADL